MAEADLVCEALVREYLAKNGLDGTLQRFETERPRNESTITNRNALRKQVGLERVALRLKKKNPDEPLPSTLEIMVSHTISKLKAAEEAVSSTSSPSAKPIRPQSAMPGGREVFANKLSSAPAPAPARARPQSAVPDMLKPRMGGFGFNGPDKAPAPAPVLESALQPQSTRATMAPLPPAPVTAEPPVVERPAIRPARTANYLQSEGDECAPAPRQPAPAHETMVMEDFDESEDEEFSTSASFPGPPSRQRDVTRRAPCTGRTTSMSPDDARRVKDRLFGRMGPPASWKQGFFFSHVTGLEYGLVQKEGGPCGILAAVQAHLLVVLSEGMAYPKVHHQSRDALYQALVQGLAKCLWQAGGKQGASVVSSSERSTQDLTLDQMLRTACVTQTYTLAGTEAAEEDGWGMLFFLYSLIMSNGLLQVEAAMDDTSQNLMGMHGYCTQDLVNLIICGHAVSNVFDGIKVLDEHTKLKGVPFCSEIGFLSLFEWYKYIEVGDNYKRANNPVWVVCCESHFTCLFAADARAAQERKPFDLFYYDGLANQEEVIKFTITHSPTGGHTARAGETIGDRGKMEGDLTPPLELVIETRWPGVKVDWNGSEPIL